jgi:hypothetical protein
MTTADEFARFSTPTILSCYAPKSRYRLFNCESPHEASDQKDVYQNGGHVPSNVQVRTMPGSLRCTRSFQTLPVIICPMPLLRLISQFRMCCSDEHFDSGWDFCRVPCFTKLFGGCKGVALTKDLGHFDGRTANPGKVLSLYPIIFGQ